MDHLLTQNSLLLLLLPTLIFFFFLLCFWVKPGQKNRAPPLPPSPPYKLPLIGHMLHLLTNPLPHHSLRDLSRRLAAPIMHLQLGHVHNIVISSAEAAEAVMKTHDLNFAQRPPVYSARILAYGCSDIVFAPYGDYWRQLRRICTLELFSSKRIHSFRSIREDEVSNLIAKIASVAGNPEPTTVDLSAMFYELTYAITSRAAFGEVVEGFLPLVDEITRVASGFNVADFYPSFEFLQVATGVDSKLRSLHRKADKVLESIISRHKQGVRSGDRETEDLVDVLLKLHDEQGNDEVEVWLTIDNIKAVLVDIFFAGTETTAATLEWAMSELIQNPTSMQKAQTEARQLLLLPSKTQPNTKATEQNIHKLTYLKSVINETMRLHPAIALLLPRAGAEDRVILGHRAPAGWSVIVNAWAIGRDPEYWTDPDRFWPERWLLESVDDDNASWVGHKGSTTHNNFHFVPFGGGRRVCPGMSFAVANMELALAHLLCWFDWKMVGGGIDMVESFGAAVRRKNGLCLVPDVHSAAGHE